MVVALAKGVQYLMDLPKFASQVLYCFCVLLYVYKCTCTYMYVRVVLYSDQDYLCVIQANCMVNH